jgi:hypothetical protein
MFNYGNESHNILIKELKVSVDMPDREEFGNDLVSGTSLYSEVYSKPFKAPPTLFITAQNMGTGDYYTLSNKTGNGFDITFRNSAGTIISRTFDWQAKGY